MLARRLNMCRAIGAVLCAIVWTKLIVNESATYRVHTIHHFISRFRIDLQSNSSLPVSAARFGIWWYCCEISRFASTESTSIASITSKLKKIDLLPKWPFSPEECLLSSWISECWLWGTCHFDRPTPPSPFQSKQEFKFKSGKDNAPIVPSFSKIRYQSKYFQLVGADYMQLHQSA